MYSHNYISVPPFVAGAEAHLVGKGLHLGFYAWEGIGFFERRCACFFLVPKDQADDSWRSKKWG